MRMLLCTFLLLLLAGPALAVDGVGEINQTCATATGCFSGDAAGFPVTISTSGSYRLTSRLVLPNENTDGILVSTSSVSIDLNGFEITGPVTCAGGPILCTPATGTGSAIDRISCRTPRSLTNARPSLAATARSISGHTFFTAASFTSASKTGCAGYWCLNS